MTQTITEELAEVTIESLKQALASAWQKGYETAQKDISEEISKTFEGQTFRECEIIDQAVAIAAGNLPW